MDNVELLGSWASPFTNRVQMALKLKSIDHEFVEVNFYSNKSERLLKANPVHKKIPVLIHQGKPICESLIILQYIDDVWASKGTKILPLDPYDRAVARFWAAYIDDKWFPLLKELEKSTDETRPAIVTSILQGLSLLEDAFNKCSEGKDFFGGDNIGYVDLVFGSYLEWISVIGSMTGNSNLLIDETTTPGLVKWAAKFRSHDVPKDVLGPPEKLLEFFMMVRAARSSSA